MKEKKGIKQFFVTLFITVLLFTSINGSILVSTQPNSSSAATVEITSKKPKLTAVKRTATQITLSYSKVKGAAGYKIYRADSINGTYQYVGASKSLEYIDTGLKYNKPYYYKVRAYINSNGKKIHSKYSNKLTILASFHKVGLNVVNATEEAVILSWKRVNGANKKASLNAGTSADKYKVYRSATKNGKYEYIGIVTGNIFIDANVEAGTTYYYRARAYKKVKGIKYNGVYSSKIEVEIEKKQVIDKDKDKDTDKDTDTDKDDDLITQIGSEEEKFANQVLVLVNQEREKAGLNRLAMSNILTPPANQRAKEIKEVFSHTRPDGRSWSSVLDDYNIRTQASGENLAYGYNTPEAVVTGWMNSPGHRANILGQRYANIGIGVYIVNGTVYCSQLFSN